MGELRAIEAADVPRAELLAGLERSGRALDAIDLRVADGARSAAWRSEVIGSRESIDGLSRAAQDARVAQYLRPGYVQERLARAHDALQLGAFERDGGDLAGRHQIGSIVSRSAQRLETAPRRVTGSPASIDPPINEAFDSTVAVDTALRARFAHDGVDGRGSAFRVVVGSEPAAWVTDEGYVLLNAIDAADGRPLGHEFIHGVQRSERLPVPHRTNAIDEASAELIGTGLVRADWVEHPDTSVRWTVESDAPLQWTAKIARNEQHAAGGVLLNAARVAVRELGGSTAARRAVEGIWWDAMLRGTQGTTDVVEASRVNVESARRLHGRTSDEARAVVAGWRAIGLGPE